jgi:alpha-tubulin suppressor-like RCC1 family protein
MRPIACTLIRRLTPVLAPALVLAALGCREDAESPTGPGSEPALEVTPAVALTFRQVSGGTHHTCGVTTGNRAYCWGTNVSGELGDGTGNSSRRPVAVAGGLSFRHVSTGNYHTCGVTTEDRAYCWGGNGGRLGDGSNSNSATPVAVVGGLRFREVSAGPHHTCGVTTDDKAYCWGINNQAQLGDGTTIDRSAPVAVAGGLRFRHVSAGGDVSRAAGDIGGGPSDSYTCGVTTSDRAYCWGNNFYGQLGDGSADFFHPTPFAVAGGLRFRNVSAGGRHACGVTTDNLAYCWGSNFRGQLGMGTGGGQSLTPVAVAGGRRFVRVSAGRGHTCAVNPFDRAFCWGANSRGQLGDGTTTDRPAPVRVLGGVFFRQVSASKLQHTCGVTPDNVGYCWGRNDDGELGDGTLLTHRKPNPIAGPIGSL